MISKYNIFLPKTALGFYKCDQKFKVFRGHNKTLNVARQIVLCHHVFLLMIFFKHDNL